MHVYIRPLLDVVHRCISNNLLSMLSCFYLKLSFHHFHLRQLFATGVMAVDPFKNTCGNAFPFYSSDHNQLFLPISKQGVTSFCSRKTDFWALRWWTACWWWCGRLNCVLHIAEEVSTTLVTTVALILWRQTRHIIQHKPLHHDVRWPDGFWIFMYTILCQR